MTNPQGPGTPFQLLFDDIPQSNNGATSLPAAFQEIYGGDWQIPQHEGRPYIYTNFAQSRDGRISYADPGIATGGDVTGFNVHDRWLMGLLRARADAILMGDVTVNMEPEYVYCAETISPDDAPAFTALRKAEGRSELPLVVILSLTGQIEWQKPCFQDARSQILLATTNNGATAVTERNCAAAVEVVSLGEESVDLHKLVTFLHDAYGVKSLLCEGGSRVLANLLDAGLVDEEFVTFCPNFIGRTPTRHRPSYTEGIAWTPTTAPYSKPLNLRRADDLLYLRTQVSYRK